MTIVTLQCIVMISFRSILSDEQWAATAWLVNKNKNTIAYLQMKLTCTFFDSFACLLHLHFHPLHSEITRIDYSDLNCLAEAKIYKYIEWTVNLRNITFNPHCLQ